MRRIGWAGVLTCVLVMGSACGSPDPPAETSAPPAAHQHSGSAGPAAPLRAGERFVDFDEQGIEQLAEPAAVKPGDTLRVTCTHDVGLRKQLPQLRNQPPRYVVWGEGTSDEMCLGVVVLSRPKA